MSRCPTIMDHLARPQVCIQMSFSSFSPAVKQQDLFFVWFVWALPLFVCPTYQASCSLCEAELGFLTVSC